ncbi:hypothetical protein PQ472_08390 [Lacticaseibacillus pabuli]|uniref:EamA-like transporter family protein n=1 Tax=Lacticaseibacillus pabuli TaxID=3025672 RepID=A0ABY7WQK5_9LACO|nr:hypothetical protein [Lacticaseibacillus sp. KACC 23028]WDF81941.1 hypothetical protein PQ472_08390 [Lacticaseibacillus sp. KACC 23028]
MQRFHRLPILWQILISLLLFFVFGEVIPSLVAYRFAHGTMAFALYKVATMLVILAINRWLMQQRISFKKLRPLTTRINY